MFKKTISLIIVIMMVFTIVIPNEAIGFSMEYNEYLGEVIKPWIENGYVNPFGATLNTSIMKIVENHLLSNLEPSSLLVDKANTVIENKTVKNLHITKNVGNGEVYLKNVTITGELLVEGGGENSIVIENSIVEHLIAKKANGKVRILIKGNTIIDLTSVESDTGTIIEQQDLTEIRLKKITVEKGSSVFIVTDNDILTSSNTDVADVNTDGIVTAKNIGSSVISVNAIDGNETIICEITVIDSANEHTPEPIDTTKEIKILTIGNSFSENASRWIYDIAKSAGVNVTIGNLYIDGCSLEKHWENASNNNNVYTYHKWISSNVTTKTYLSIKTAILDEDWDYITFQQVSGDSGYYITFQPYLDNLISYVKDIAPNAKLALNMTWAYAEDCANENFNKYNNKQKTMYNAITNAYQSAIAETDIDIIIPCGTAIQNARTNQILKKIDNELTRDGYHLNEKMGSYIAGLTFFQSLIINHENLEKDLYKDVTFYPEMSDVKSNSIYLAYLAKKSAIRAVNNPYKTSFIR
ncbi:DUF4886 domain-containing protein [Sedimentibacter sp. MB31-C6]|uniref:DUF4886 domain-containing protein n=1 Tax=Sedimentibacter sp. MB31-C6 TaxID=3109366 RepID=UPI002DDCBD1E|nr:DUF4886 domain-containing protein [Sedimentibacter sp. MB36-C1]WSI05236.1 DUF4886 domain-containing protein [Sedimentibacter sp. MB36-C1]